MPQDSSRYVQEGEVGQTLRGEIILAASAPPPRSGQIIGFGRFHKYEITKVYPKVYLGNKSLGTYQQYNYSIQVKRIV